MLIDSTHKHWAWVTLALGAAAVALYVLLDRRAPGGLTGGSAAGLWYGVAGAALMLFAGLLIVLRHVPKRWLFFHRKVWLRGHIWLGSLSGVLILCHSGFRWGGPLEIVLWVVFALVLATGFLGLWLQSVLPRMLTTRIQAEAPYEQIPRLCDAMRREADELIDKARADAKVDDAAKERLGEFYQKELRPFLGTRYERSAPLANALRAEMIFGRLRAVPALSAVHDALARLETYCAERRQLGEQERLYRWLHGWLLVHVPLSLALLVLGVAHVLASLYY